MGVFARRILFMRTGDDGLGFTSAVDAIDQGRFLIGVVAAAKLLHASHAKKVVSKTMEAFLGAGSFQLTHSAILEVMSQHAARAARVGVGGQAKLVPPDVQALTSGKYDIKDMAGGLSSVYHKHVLMLTLGDLCNVLDAKKQVEMSEDVQVLMLSLIHI